jgi:hypothetical protein
MRLASRETGASSLAPGVSRENATPCPVRYGLLQVLLVTTSGSCGPGMPEVSEAAPSSAVVTMDRSNQVAPTSPVLTGTAQASSATPTSVASSERVRCRQDASSRPLGGAAPLGSSSLVLPAPSADAAGGPPVEPRRERGGSAAASGRGQAPRGELPPDDIRRPIRKHYGCFRKCFELGLTASPNLVGRVAFRLVIEQGTGAVLRAEDAGSDFPNAKVIACIVDEAKGIRFPPPARGDVEVVYPVMFSPGSDDDSANGVGG